MITFVCSDGFQIKSDYFCLFRWFPTKIWLQLYPGFICWRQFCTLIFLNGPLKKNDMFDFKNLRFQLSFHMYIWFRFSSRISRFHQTSNKQNFSNVNMQEMEKFYKHIYLFLFSPPDFGETSTCIFDSDSASQISSFPNTQKFCNIYKHTQSCKRKCFTAQKSHFMFLA